jgi:hypothetical protein
MKNRVRLTESQLHGIIRRCVNEALNEAGEWKEGPLYRKIVDGYQNNGQGVERCDFPTTGIRAYNLRSSKDGWNNWTRISGHAKDPNSLTYMNFRDGGMEQLESAIDDIAEYFGTTPNDIKERLGVTK